MGILICYNTLFSDGGDYADIEKAVARAKEMIEEGQI